MSEKSLYLSRSFGTDLEIVAFHRVGEVKRLQFLYRERESLNLGCNLS